MNEVVPLRPQQRRSLQCESKISAILYHVNRIKTLSTGIPRKENLQVAYQEAQDAKRAISAYVAALKEDMKEL